MNKIPLYGNEYEIRVSQIIRGYGPGALIDFPGQTLTVARPENWIPDVSYIYDERFARSLGVKRFASPNSVSYVRYPEWYYCPRCCKFQTIDKWIAEHKRKNGRDSHNESYMNMIRQLRCPDCKRELVLPRFLTMCENGHLNDFPWSEWVHVKSGKPICKRRPVMKMETGRSDSEGTDAIVVTCEECGAKASLDKAFDNYELEKMDKRCGKIGTFWCSGHHAFKNEIEECQAYPKVVTGRSLSTYFPLTYSSLVIPPYSNELRAEIEQSEEYDYCEKALADEETEKEREELIQKRIDRWSEKIAREIDEEKEEVKAVLLEKWGDKEDSVDVESLQYRIEEYEALTGKVKGKGEGDFMRTEMEIGKYNIPFLKSVSLIEKVRIVTALLGFSRGKPTNKMSDPQFVEIKEDETQWYPANEVRGEGIFIELDSGAIAEWLKKNSEMKERAKLLQKNWDKSFEGESNSRKVTCQYVLLHTISHLLIKQLSFECGYNVSSLSERIYVAEKSEGREMAGILIYTSSGDAEGTLGGLVRQGRPDMLPRVIRKAVHEARICSNDPVCMMSRGQGRESLNLAACYACALLPETCCAERNSLLDRAMVIGTYEHPEAGFWSGL